MLEKLAKLCAVMLRTLPIVSILVVVLSTLSRGSLLADLLFFFMLSYTVIGLLLFISLGVWSYFSKKKINHFFRGI